MRVAHLTATFPPYLGGAGTAAWHTAEELAARGHEVEVFTARTPGAVGPERATVHRLEPAFAIGNAPLLPRLAALRGYDVVHLHHPFIFGTELLHLARMRDRMPLVVSYHNELVGEGGRAPLFAGWERTWGAVTLRAAKAVCVVSRAHAATVSGLRRLAERRPDALVEVPNGVDLERFAPGPDVEGLRAAHGVPVDAVVIAFVATLDRAHYLKRPDLAVAVAAALDDPRVHLLVAGGGEWLEDLRAQAADAGIADRTTFLGAVAHDRLPDVLRAADLLLVTSDRESFGIVLIEAMACGLPTVATDLPGIRAVTEEGRTGLLAPAGDAAGLAARVGELFDAGPAGRAAMGAAGRARCEAQYGWRAVVDRVEAVYAAAAGTAVGRRSAASRSSGA